MNDLDRVTSFLEQLEYDFKVIDPREEIIRIDDEPNGIRNMLLDCEQSLLVIEQFICDLRQDLQADTYKWLLQTNRQLVHGAFALDETGNRLLFRDSLQLESLNINELKSSIESCGLALAEHANQLIQIAQK